MSGTYVAFLCAGLCALAAGVAGAFGYWYGWAVGAKDQAVSTLAAWDDLVGPDGCSHTRAYRSVVAYRAGEASR